jgi:UDPglucose--hexose-1-phosphate uridylyltransferase
MSEIRENRITGESVIIAPERAKRGGNLVPIAERTETAAFLASCPFWPGNEGLTAEERFRLAGETDGWILRSVVNKFSVLSPQGEVGPPRRLERGESSVNGVGLHEVLIESPRHNGLMARFPASHLQRILEAYRHRFSKFYRDPRVPCNHLQESRSRCGRLSTTSAFADCRPARRSRASRRANRASSPIL